MLGERLAADLLGERLRALRRRASVHEHGLAPAARERARHVARADEPDLHAAVKRTGSAAQPPPQDWLKKPFSISRARSSAEISTLRGVSMKTLSAIRCMPPSSA